MSKGFDYKTFSMRNSGYISEETQNKIRETRLLIAGCGIGSSLAICATRMGFENFILIDGDTLDQHNLNRQFYDYGDVGEHKVSALKKQILRINPEANVEAIPEFLNGDNTDDVVGRSDVVFDTVDFLDLPALLRLHGSAKVQQKHIFTALSVGFGALVWFFPANSPLSLGDIVAPSIERVEALGGDPESYVNIFASFMEVISPYLDEEVVHNISHVLTLMKDGKPCPASQLAVGSFTVAAMAGAMMHDFLAGQDIPEAPQFVLHSFKKHETQIINPLG